MSDINADRMLTDEIFELARKGRNLKQIKADLQLTMNMESIRKRIKRHPDYTPEIGEMIKVGPREENALEEDTVIPDRQEVEILEGGVQRSTRNIEIEDENILRSEKDLLLLHNYDPAMWEIVNAKNSKWNAQKKGGVITTLYSSRITVKPIRGGIPEKVVENLYDELASGYKRATFDRNKECGDKMLEINICDLHLGKLSWSRESGENYDSKMARKRFFQIINNVMDRTKDLDLDRILFVFGNDFFQINSVDSKTVAGTFVDSDSRLSKIFLDGTQMITEAIEVLAERANVDVVLVPGNHDSLMCFTAFEVIRAWFKDDKRVKVDDDIRERKYYLYGVNLLGLTHGDKEGKRLPSLMAIEVPEYWAKSKIREWHTAHRHSIFSYEEGGTVVRHLPSVTGTDHWHFQSGFVGAIARAQSFIWDKSVGLTDTLYSYVK